MNVTRTRRSWRARSAIVLVALASTLTTVVSTAPTSEAAGSIPPAAFVAPMPAVNAAAQSASPLVAQRASATAASIDQGGCLANATTYSGYRSWLPDRRNFCAIQTQQLISASDRTTVCGTFRTIFIASLEANASNWSGTLKIDSWTYANEPLKCPDPATEHVNVGMNSRWWVTTSSSPGYAAVYQNQLFTLSGKTFNAQYRTSAGDYKEVGYADFTLSTASAPRPVAVFDYPYGDTRCDRNGGSAHTVAAVEACRFFLLTPVYNLSRASFPNVWNNDHEAINAGAPSLLHRVWNDSQRYIDNRNTTRRECASVQGTGSCDEYPYAAAWEGTSNPNYVHRYQRIDGTENTDQGRSINSSFYGPERILGDNGANAGDPFMVNLVP